MSTELKIAISDEGGNTPIKVLYLSGDVDANTHKDIESKATELIKSGSNNILIDLSNVNYMGSAGLRSLNIISKSISETNGQFKLSNPSEPVAKVMKTLGFHEFFDIHDTIDNAISAFH